MNSVNNKLDNLKNVTFKFLRENIVTVVFITLCIFGIIFSGQPMFFITKELITRITRNSFLVLSLIIPVLSGMGMNFGIVIGAMAGQMAMIIVTHWIIKGAPVTGVVGLLLCIVLSTPLAIIFGYFSGKLLNKTKGQEMISSMILGFFANGLYQLLFLFLVGTVIPMNNPTLVLANGIGIKNTIDLSGGLKYSLDGMLEMPLFITVAILCLMFIALHLIKILYTRMHNLKYNAKKSYIIIGIMALFIILSIVVIDPFSLFAGSSNGFVKQLRMFNMIKIPIMTVVVIALLCIFNITIVKTKLGQDFRTVGQNMHIAKVSGIKIDRIRIVAIVISTVLAAWGQIIFLQNIGTLNTYGSHEQIAMFSVAALLIGGATASKATVGQALLGTILFHTLFIVSPQAGKNLFGDAQIGEHFRVFVAYGVIGLSLGLHAWKSLKYKKAKESME